MISWAAVVTALGQAVTYLSGPAMVQAEQLVGLFEQALPAIEQGVMSAEPFIVAGFKLLGNGGQPISAADWEAQLTLLKAQTDTVDEQVAADTKAQP